MAAIGATALTIAGLGIVNTMVMSIIERRREIGLLKSLGAEDADVRRLFLAESGLIGGAGAIGGVALGWIVSRVIAFAGMTWMRSQNMPALDPFAMPVAVVAVALLFGIGAAVLAGLYPAARAARVDPVQALRGE
jgi:putative ABC transport system permease protein